jgi:hypothetical protein
MDWVAKESGVRLPVEARDFSFLCNVQISSVAHPASYPMGTGASWGGRRGMKLTSHLHLLLRLRMHVAIPPLPMSLHGMVLNQAQEQLYNNNKMESSLLQG